MSAPLAKRIRVIWLYVRDLKRSVSFYNEKLGIPVQPHPQDPHWAEHVFPDGTRFALHEARREAGISPGTINLDCLTETAPVHLRGVSKLFVAQLDDQELAVLERALDKVTLDCTFG